MRQLTTQATLMTMFNRVRGRLSKVQADVDPHQWRLPSSYSISKSSTRQTVIPDPRIFRNAFVPSDFSLASTEASLIYPDISHCAVHLALLECFRKLRLTASGLDVEVQPLPAYEKVDQLKDSYESRRLPESERWDLLIRLAVARFTAWWMNIDQVFHHATAYTHHAGNKSVVQLTKDYLPPLDVLLVWYAFMLDEEHYASVCRDREMRELLELCFPWPAIRDNIDMDDMAFKLPRAAENLFRTLSGQSADTLTYLEQPPAYMEVSMQPLQVDLFSKVKEQERFIDEAHDLLWIRSPALAGSLERSSIDYLDFQLEKKPEYMGERTLPFGVDLLLRTHKLYPKQYELFCRGPGGAISTTDTKSSVSTHITVSSEDEQQGRPAKECCCWTCERIKDDLPAFTYDKDVHASSSSDAAYDVSLLTSLSSEQLRSIQDDLGFFKAAEDARQQGLPLPTRPPTAAEKAAEKMEAKKKADAGVLPGLNEYVVVLPDGRRKIKRVRYARATYGLSMAI